MRRLFLRTLALLLVAPTLCFATVDVSPAWEAVSFTAGVFRVEARATFPDYGMTKFRVWVSGKRVHIPEAEFRQIRNPRLEKITVTYVTGFKGSAYIEIPFDVEVPHDAFEDGGTGTCQAI